MSVVVLWRAHPKMLKHFGYRHLGFIFITLVVIRESGFYYKKKYYPWKAIVQITVSDKTIRDEGSVYGVGRGEIHLNTGKILLIKEESLERKDGAMDVGFLSPFDELIFELKANYKKYQKAVTHN